ncbi:thyroid hormone receptor interactor 4 [Capsaspora owczarzaki ATCC 30864]|uniref:Thyroid hormone receptor interactor 4 n=1 Tax=Capsaspora owczarzaki (strain ATCC 30864) TaxID=595528 RepID=A0A0D2U818_CAPO3|nr:thyroid hormone receptor interactor 4 [Capsaspora owczarzaki ATCC 30864]KJE91246.1 thyroid hormone receptor interactor 4 [Capsaspora owczarzaki ATCC 30864]|eukprot:XP_004349159.1 thyroid hormone receptor interactor 4 [Capsaspora owczarzaki ATCC 30864]
MGKQQRGVPAFSNAGQRGTRPQGLSQPIVLQAPPPPTSAAAMMAASQQQQQPQQQQQQSQQKQQKGSPAAAAAPGSAPIRAWATQELTKLLGFESAEVVDYVMGIPAERELREYLLEGGLLSATSPATTAFVNELCKRQFPAQTTATAAVTAPAGAFVYIKSVQQEEAKRSPSPKHQSQSQSQSLVTQPISSVSANVAAAAASQGKPTTTSNVLGAPSAVPSPSHTTSGFASNAMPSGQSRDNNAPTSATTAAYAAKTKAEDHSQPIVFAAPAPVLTPEQAERQRTQELAKLRAKKTRYVSLASLHTSDFLAPGRQECGCLASRHELVNNCTECGRIVCAQERAGACFTCGAIVFSKSQALEVQRGSKHSEKVKAKLIDQFAKEEQQRLANVAQHDREQKAAQDRIRQQALLAQGTTQLVPTGGGEDAYDKAVQHKNKLLEFDRTSAKRTQVIDDESDYFSADNNKWLTQAQKDALKAKEAEIKRHREEAKRKVTIDLISRQVVAADMTGLRGVHDADIHEVVDATLAKASIAASSHGKSDQPNAWSTPMSIQPVYLPPKPIKTKAAKGANAPAAASATTTTPIATSSATARHGASRVQDKAIQEMVDVGVCLSMHQPWATLLVQGIKKVEGRTWYSAHRGRLWIAAAAKTPDPAEIAEVEAMYRSRDPAVVFPTDYPTGCLLGAVDMVDCLSQDQFASQSTYDSSESQAPFVFICENPSELLLKLPVKGDHKIWKLEHSMHSAARAAMRADR